MIKRSILCVMFILSIFVGFQGCSTQEPQEDISNEIWCTPVYFPENIDPTNMRMLNLPTRQQYVYKSVDGKDRLVIDINISDADSIVVDNKQDIKIRSKTGTAYVYSGEEFTFGGASPSAASGLVHMTEGETVIEWSEENTLYRIHGTYSLDELLKIAEALEVRLP